MKALRGLDLAVPAGSVCGLLGPNGAGKTTAVRVLTTLVVPDSGSARVGGHDILREPGRARRAFAATGQDSSVDVELTGRENLLMFAALRRLRGAARRARTGELLERFGLAEAADRPVRTWSGGMRRRLDLAASLVVRPRVLFLDEPTTGLDPRGRNQIRAAVRELSAGGTTVLLTTQYLEEADQLADEIVLMRAGRAAESGTPAALKAQIGSWAEVTVGDAAELAGAAAVLDRLTGARPVLHAERRTVGAVARDPALSLPALVRAMDTAGVAVTDASLRAPTLDEVFLRLTDAAPGDQGVPGERGRSGATPTDEESTA